VFLKAFRQNGFVSGRLLVAHLVYRITINHCRNLQQSWNDRSMFSNAMTPSGTTPLQNRFPISCRSETKELGQRIQKALDGLSRRISPFAPPSSLKSNT